MVDAPVAPTTRNIGRLKQAPLRALYFGWVLLLPLPFPIYILQSNLNAFRRRLPESSSLTIEQESYSLYTKLISLYRNYVWFNDPPLRSTDGDRTIVGTAILVKDPF